MLWILLLLIGMVAFSSYVRGAAERVRNEAAGSHRFRIRIRLAGRKPSRVEMRERFALEEEIERRRLGAVAGSSVGEWVMWVEVATAAEGEEVLRAIREVIEATGLGERAEVAPAPAATTASH